jgi:hypothetical protein
VFTAKKIRVDYQQTRTLPYWALTIILSIATIDPPNVKLRDRCSSYSLSQDWLLREISGDGSLKSLEDLIVLSACAHEITILPNVDPIFVDRKN